MRSLNAGMPLYEYTCAKCGKPSEILVKSTSEKPACPHCGGTDLHKEFSAFAAKGVKSDHVHTGSCGCGKAPGSCGMN